MSSHHRFPESITLNRDAALDLLAVLEDARDALTEAGDLATAFDVDEQVRRVTDLLTEGWGE